MSKSFLRGLSAAVAIVVAGCGGGGGGDGGGGVTLSGTITVPETASVDSDTNDPLQAGRTSNSDFDVAQTLTTPTFLIGSVNLPQVGPAGPNLQNGDEFDVYRVALQAGQTIELEFSGATASNDLELFAIAEDMTEEIGASTGTNPYECLKVVRPGTHYIVVQAYEGGSMYNLRIGAPTATSNCTETISRHAGIVPGEVLARPLTQGDRVRSQAVRQKALAAAGLRTVSAATADDSVPVVLQLPSAGAERVAALTRLSSLAASGATSASKQVASASGDKLASVGLAGAPAALRDVMDTIAYAKGLARTGAWAYAEPNTTATLHALVGTFPPNDRLYPNQRWHYDMINVQGAMAALVPQTQLTQRPIVAVIDSGIVANHPDLAPQIFVQASFTTAGFSPSADDPSRPGDPTGFHGTHVAGTIAASTFDGTGVAGAAPMAQLMPIRVFDQGADASRASDIVNAILYAARLPNASNTLPARRADVINMSLGSTRACPAAYADAITKAINAGVIVVAASGNEAAAVRNAPSNCPGVISVGALDARKQKAPYSNTDAELTLVAPGGDSRVSTTGTGLPDEVYSTLGDFNAAGVRVPSYGGLQGTSMATPHASAVIAMMRFANPAITLAQVNGLLAQGAITTDLGVAGRDSSFGWGLLDAGKAVTAALTLTGTTPAPVAGIIVAQPSALDFGALRTTAEIQLSFQGDPTAETVTAVASSSPAVTVTQTAADATAKVLRYAVTVSRDTLPLGSTFATLRFTTTARTIDVQVSVLKTVAGAAAAADFGTVYVLVVDPDKPEGEIEAVVATAKDGKYTWSKSGVTQTRVKIIAGTDIDNDGLLCQRGEACGGYPQFNGDATVIDVTGNRNDLDFELSPFGGVNAAASAAGAPASPVFRRRLP